AGREGAGALHTRAWSSGKGRGPGRRYGKRSPPDTQQAEYRPMSSCNCPSTDAGDRPPSSTLAERHRGRDPGRGGDDTEQGGPVTASGEHPRPARAGGSLLQGTAGSAQLGAEEAGGKASRRAGDVAAGAGTGA